MVQPWAKKDYKEHSEFTDWYAPGFRQKVTDPVEGPIEVWLELIEVKDDKVTTDIHYLFTRFCEELISRNTLMFRTREEITKSLEGTNFEVENVYGNWDGSIATPESPEFIFVAKRI